MIRMVIKRMRKRRTMVMRMSWRQQNKPIWELPLALQRPENVGGPKKRLTSLSHLSKGQELQQRPKPRQRPRQNRERPKRRPSLAQRSWQWNLAQRSWQWNLIPKTRHQRRSLVECRRHPRSKRIHLSQKAMRSVFSDVVAADLHSKDVKPAKIPAINLRNLARSRFGLLSQHPPSEDKDFKIEIMQDFLVPIGPLIYLNLIFLGWKGCKLIYQTYIAQAYKCLRIILFTRGQGRGDPCRNTCNLRTQLLKHSLLQSSFQFVRWP